MTTSTPKGDPILVDCAGSGCPGNLPGDDTALCTMCGALLPLDDGVVVEHQRDDIIGRINRRDFG